MDFRRFTRVVANAGRLITLVVTLLSSAVGCGGGSSSSPTNPTPPPTQTVSRVIGVSGNLAFGDVTLGASRTATLTVSNTGSGTLSVTGISVSGGFADQTVASATTGQIAAGGILTITLTFRPTVSGLFSGTLIVNGDQTGGTNSIAISASVSTFGGSWSGRYFVERCDGTGSIQDVICSPSRGAFPPGASLPISLNLTQNDSSVSGTFALGTIVGVANGVVSATGVLTLQGTATGGTATAAISSWSTTVQGNALSGTATYNLTASGVPGVAVMVTRLGTVTK